MEVTLLFIAGICAGSLITFIVLRVLHKARSASFLSREEVSDAYVVREMFDNLQYTLVEREKELKEQEKDIIALHARLSALEKEKDILGQLQEQNREAFRNLAGDILREKTRDLADTNKTSMEHILSPLKTGIDQFRKTIEDTRKEDIQDITSLKKELENLQRLNLQLSEDAQQLAGALKSDVKIQGNWGEDRLRMILEAEGLQRYIDYHNEAVYRDTEEDRNRRPDFILKLPDGKHLVIDSKVSLNAYVAYFNASDPQERKAHLAQLVRNIQDHIDELSAKNYPSLNGLNTPDFVFMFMHFESALTLALNENPELFNRALKKKIVLITPSTLAATFKIVRLLWQHENRVRNVEEIFRQCGLLYDKFILFLEEMQKVGNSLKQAASAHDDAMKRLKDGKRRSDTIIGKFETIRDLDARTTREMPPQITTDMDIRFPEQDLPED